MDGGVELTAYLVNESRARCPELSRDRLAGQWIPAREREQVRALWDEYAGSVYPHDDLVCSLRGRYILDLLEQVLRQDPDTVLLVCGAGFTSYPWLLPFPAAVEADLPRVIEAKRRRVAELVAAGVIEPRPVEQLPVDLADRAARERLVERVRAVAAGRPIAYLAEGLIFYLPGADARAVAGLGAATAAGTVSVVTYWPVAAADNRVLAAQREWFRHWAVAPEATYLTTDDLAAAAGGPVDNHSPEDLQRRYLGEVSVPETELVPEHVAVVGR
ncbi:MAG: hypothetical protein GEV12_17290 [Micromonosporaceae bacterium]|nr:hypothetical protein [Micromonosporaceae bacterium]